LSSFSCWCSAAGATGLAVATGKPLGNVPRFFVVGYSTRRSRTTCLVRMSAIGTKRTSMIYGRMSTFGGKADIGISGRHVREMPDKNQPIWRRGTASYARPPRAREHAQVKEVTFLDRVVVDVRRKPRPVSIPCGGSVSISAFDIDMNLFGLGLLRSLHG
jgi:hypothetical protein